MRPRLGGRLGWAELMEKQWRETIENSTIKGLPCLYTSVGHSAILDFEKRRNQNAHRNLALGPRREQILTARGMDSMDHVQEEPRPHRAGQWSGASTPMLRKRTTPVSPLTHCSPILPHSSLRSPALQHSHVELQTNLASAPSVETL